MDHRCRESDLFHHAGRVVRDEATECILETERRHEIFRALAHSGIIEATENARVVQHLCAGESIEKAKAISQAEVAGAFGIPAVVLQYIVGLASATAKASHKDSREQAYTECLMPMQRGMAEDFTTQLLTHFTADPRYRVVFDYRKVGALADDANETAKRWLDLFTGNVAMLSEARRGNGLKTDSTHDYFARELPGSPASTADPAQVGTVADLPAPDPNDNEKTL